MTCYVQLSILELNELSVTCLLWQLVFLNLDVTCKLKELWYLVLNIWLLASVYSFDELVVQL